MSIDAGGLEHSRHETHSASLPSSIAIAFRSPRLMRQKLDSMSPSAMLPPSPHPISPIEEMSLSFWLYDPMW
jgi:hypothetical protein